MMLSKRDLDCVVIDGAEVSAEEFAANLKKAWQLRALTDPTKYVMASSDASEEQISLSGKSDFENEILPRIKEYLLPSLFDNKFNGLEIGCGIGRLLEHASPFFSMLYGVDICKDLLDIAANRLSILSNITLVETDGLSLKGIADTSINLVYEYIVFQHIGSMQIIRNYIHEISRVLKPGGVAVLHGRDEHAFSIDSFSGNTWHGIKTGPDCMRDCIQGTQLSIRKEEGEGTTRYWIVLQKES